jgi:hypothetical protein
MFYRIPFSFFIEQMIANQSALILSVILRNATPLGVIVTIPIKLFHFSYVILLYAITIEIGLEQAHFVFILFYFFPHLNM